MIDWRFSGRAVLCLAAILFFTYTAIVADLHGDMVGAVICILVTMLTVVLLVLQFQKKEPTL